jgi:hypothetical protein
MAMPSSTDSADVLNCRVDAAPLTGDPVFDPGADDSRCARSRGPARFWRMASETAEADLVALGVGQGDPAPVTLADVCLPRAKGEQAAELGCLIAVDGFDVQLQLVLDELAWAMARGPGHEASRPPGEAADSSCDG